MTRVLALDIGTSSVRAVVHDSRGRPVAGAEHQTRYELTHGHDGRADFDVARLVAAVREAVDGADDNGYDAVGISCFWHGLIALDRTGEPLTPLVTWRDMRSVAAAEQLAERIDPVAAHRRTGCTIHPSYWPAKLAWLRAEHPDTFARAAHFVSLPDYLLGGDPTTSLSMASGTGLLDLRTRDWDVELLDVLGLHADRLPALSDEPTERDGRPWYPALGDGACSNLGAGCTGRERAALMIGTSGAFRLLYESDEPEPREGLFLYRADAHRLVEGGSLSDGGNLYAWLDKTVKLPREHTGIAERVPAGHGLTFLTLLGGERSPGWNGRAHGAIAGLTFDTSTTDLLQAALEGIAFRFREVADLVPGVREVVTTGHALRAAPDWNQILADVLERPVTLSGIEESSARGAAVAVLERLGEAPDQAPLERVFLPREERFAALREAHRHQRELYAATSR